MDRGYDVVICDIKDCTAAAKALTARHPNGRVFHTQCDVSDAKSCEKLGQFAKEKLGNIGYWINNAGINGGRKALSELTMGQVELVVKVNLLGILYCTKVAMDIMAEQEGVTGHIFNTVGSLNVYLFFYSGFVLISKIIYVHIIMCRCYQTWTSTINCQSCKGNR